MIISQMIHDKVELYEADSMATLEKKINDHIDINAAILLEVHHVSYHPYISPEGRQWFQAMVHYKQKK